MCGPKDVRSRTAPNQNTGPDGRHHADRGDSAYAGRTFGRIAACNPLPGRHQWDTSIADSKIGSAVKSVKPGQFIIDPVFAFDNSCPGCRAGYQTSCKHKERPGAAAARPAFGQNAIGDARSRQKIELPAHWRSPCLAWSERSLANFVIACGKREAFSFACRDVV
jgi:hypothetical protein